jgi:hypothetical protein
MRNPTPEPHHENGMSLANLRRDKIRDYVTKAFDRDDHEAAACCWVELLTNLDRIASALEIIASPTADKDFGPPPPNYLGPA